MLRKSQIAVAGAILPMMALGLMSSLSGGGLTPAFQQIGGKLMNLSPVVGLASVATSWLLEQISLKPLAYLVLCIPCAMWGMLIMRLNRETGFFL